MRITFVTTSYPRHPRDAGGTFVRALARALVARGHAVRVIAPEGAEATPGLEVVGVRCGPSRWSPFGRDGLPETLRREPLRALGFATFLAGVGRVDLAADAVVTHWPFPTAIVPRLRDRAGWHVALWHSADVHAAARLHVPRAWLARLADRHLFVAAHLRDRLGLDGAIVPMGIDLPPFVERPPLAGRRIRLLSLSRLVPIKRVDRAIELARARPDVELVIAGEGLERPRLEALASGLMNVRFVGEVGPDERDAWLQWADMLVAVGEPRPSGRQEGAPLAPREALAAGCRVLATSCEAHNELAHRVGSAMRVVAPDGLADALDALLDLDLAVLVEARDRLRSDAWSTIAVTLEEALVRPPRQLRQESFSRSSAR